MKVYIDLSDKRNETVLRELTSAGFEQEKKPFSAIGEGYVYVFTPKTVIGIRQAFDIAENSVVFAYQFEKEAQEVLSARGCVAIDIMKDETFVWENALLTADAAAQILEKKGCLKASILITGYGRVAKATAAKIARGGGKVTVAARSALSREEAYHNSLAAVNFDEIDWSAFDVIINTVPAVILGEKELSQMKRGAYLLDLASLPGGYDEEAAKKYGVCAERALGLPGKFYPEKAGKILFKRIKKEL